VARVPFWLDDAFSFDHIVIGGRKVRGLVEVTPELGQKLDEKSPKDGSGANLTFNGYELATFTIEITAYSADQWFDMQELGELIRPRAPQKKKATPPAAFDVVHPLLSFWGINKIYVKKIRGPKHDKEGQKATLTLDCIEYAKITQATSGGAGAGTVKPTPLGSFTNSLTEAEEKAQMSLPSDPGGETSSHLPISYTPASPASAGPPGPPKSRSV